MFTNYDEALDWIHSRLRLGIKPGLKRMEWMMDKLGHPENKLNVLHVGGTNGKGSTVAHLRSMLNAAGKSAGTFTSPYIEQFNERISVDGKPISDEEITMLAGKIKPLADELEQTELGSPTEFEVITAMALVYFAFHRPVDFAIIEVGLGGMYDSTNVVHPILAFITNIGMDHMQILGNTIEEIAVQKAGIIKKGVPLFTAAEKEEALNIFEQTAAGQKAPVFRLGNEFTATGAESVPQGERFTFTFNGDEPMKLETSMLGRHQVKNAALAVAGIIYLRKIGKLLITNEEMMHGLRNTYWPGRMEVLHEHPDILLDGAHNPEGLRAFKEAIGGRYNGRKIKLVFAALQDKDLTEMFKVLADIPAELYLTSFDFPRAADAQTLKNTGGLDAETDDDWMRLLGELTSGLEQDEVLAVTGSLYFIALAKPFLKKQLIILEE